MSSISQLSQSISKSACSFIKNIGNDFKAIGAGFKSPRSAETKAKASLAALRVFATATIATGVVAMLWAVTPLVASLAVVASVSTFVLGHDLFSFAKGVEDVAAKEHLDVSNYFKWDQSHRSAACEEMYIPQAVNKVKSFF